MADNPMQQFTVNKIGPEIKIAGVDLSFTNASLFMIINKLALVKDKSTPAILISGPILLTVNCCIGLSAIKSLFCLIFFLHLICRFYNV